MEGWGLGGWGVEGMQFLNIYGIYATGIKGRLNFKHFKKSACEQEWVIWWSVSL